MHVTGDVDSRVAQLLQDKIGIPPEPLEHVMTDQLLHFPGSCFSSDLPDGTQCMCLSMGAPLPHDEDRLDTDMMKLWLHVIVFQNTMISFTKLSGVTVGMLNSHVDIDKFRTSDIIPGRETLLHRLLKQAATADVVSEAAPLVFDAAAHMEIMIDGVVTRIGLMQGCGLPLQFNCVIAVCNMLQHAFFDPAVESQKFLVNRWRNWRNCNAASL